jgi:hypothetical protein
LKFRKIGEIQREKEIERMGEIRKGETAKDGARGKWVKNP